MFCFQFCNIEILIKRENTHKTQTNEYYAVCQTDTRIVWESFMSKSKQLCMWVVWRWWLQAILTEKSPSFTCRPHNWVLYIHTSCMREPPALKQASCLELRVACNWKATKLQTCCMNVCMHVLHSMIRTYLCVPMYCRTFWWDSLQLEKKNHSTLQNIYLWRKVVCFVLQLWDPPNQDASDRVLGVFGKLWTRRGCIWLGSMTFGLVMKVKPSQHPSIYIYLNMITWKPNKFSPKIFKIYERQ